MRRYDCYTRPDPALKQGLARAGLVRSKTLVFRLPWVLQAATRYRSGTSLHLPYAWLVIVSTFSTLRGAIAYAINRGSTGQGTPAAGFTRNTPASRVALCATYTGTLVHTLLIAAGTRKNNLQELHGHICVYISSPPRLLVHLFLLFGRSRSPTRNRSFSFFREVIWAVQIRFHSYSFHHAPVYL